MSTSRPVREVRKSPVRYFAEVPVKRERSRSKGRKPKTPEKEEISKKATRDNSRRRSPSRNARSPARSPARKKVLDQKVNKKKSSPAHLVETKSSHFEDIIRSSLTPNREIEDVIRSSVSRFEEVLAEVGPTIKRRKAGFTNEADVLKKQNEDLKYGKLTENNEKEKDKEAITSASTNKISFGTSINSWGELVSTINVFFLMLLVPALVTLAQLSCTQENCVTVPTKILPLRRFLDLESSIWYITFVVTQLLITAIPLGPNLNGIGSKGQILIYKRNGPGCLILTLVLLGGIKYCPYLPVIKILDKTLPLLVTAILTASFVITILYCLSNTNSRNQLTNNSNFISDLWMGKEINPRWGSFDVKMWLIRTSLISVIVYNGLLILKEVETKPNPSEYSVMLLIICTLQSLLALDPLIFESSLISSSIVTQEGTGYNLIMTLAVLPFWFTLIPKHLYLSKSEYNLWICIATVTLHLIGHTIYRVSCYQNDKFHRSPLSVKSSDVLYSRHPEKVFRGGLRSKVRYPAISGMLLMVVSWCAGSLFTTTLHWIPILILSSSVLASILYVRRLDCRSNLKHNITWTSYMSSTSSALIPYVY